MVLPIVEYKDKILRTVQNNDFTIISAETGAGKSTQVPKFLTEQYNRVVVTEPRIMAAKTLAMRVSEELCTDLGNEVGYMTAYDKCHSKESKLLYCTDGLQLVRTIFDKNKGERSSQNVLIVDEVHEWNNNIECLVAWCKHVRYKWNTKVVLMSATMECEKLAEFFENSTEILQVPGNLYDVEVEERDADRLIYSIKENIEKRKNILVFVPGKKEIKEVITTLSDMKVDATLLPLHSEIDWDEQKKCFLEYNRSKVIISTNIAQTSITIPDIDVVIDTGKANVSIAQNGVQGLYTIDISIADIMQRKGRAGRTKGGKYILCSDVKIDEREKYSVPEIQRSLLDRSVLQMAAVGLDAEELEFFHQPDREAIKNAKEELRILGATDEKGNVTELGVKMAKIPLSPQFSRMIIEAEKYSVTEDVITIAAIMEMGSLLSKDTAYYRFTREQESDLLAEMDVWNYINSLKFIDFKELGINKKNFFRIKEHLKKLKETLYGIVELTSSGNREDIIRSCVTGLVSHVYKRLGWYDNKFKSSNDVNFMLDRKSCIGYTEFCVGIPRIIEINGRYGYKQRLNILGFATKISTATFLKNIPSWLITVNIEESYSSIQDAIKVRTTKKYGSIQMSEDIEYFHDHPRYEELKEKFMEEERSYKRLFGSSYSRPAEREQISIDGKIYEVKTSLYDHNKVVSIDLKTLFTTEVKEYVLPSGERILFEVRARLDAKRDTSIENLRKYAEQIHIQDTIRNKQENYKDIKVLTINDVLDHLELLGKVEITKDLGGYGENPVYAYGFLILKKNTVSFSISLDDNETAASTVEALQYLIIKHVEKNYGLQKFSHGESCKARKNLTEAERKIKEEFDSFVREILLDLKPENVKDSIEFIDEYYDELMK